jgi:hypothetical protein
MKDIALMLTLITGFVSFHHLPAQDLPGRKTQPMSFADTVKENFRQWDSNGDGQLSLDEVNTALANPKIKNESAAAIVAIEKVIRGHKYKLQPLTTDYLIFSPLKENAKFNKETDSADDESKAATFTHEPSFQQRYEKAMKKLRDTSRELFPQSLPSFTATHQGALGDCPFVSTVGAVVYRNPADIKAMFKQNTDRSFVVTFGNGNAVRIAHLTDADIAMWSSAGPNGLWFTVLEKAYRKSLVQSNKQAGDKPANIYEKFASSHTVEIFSGHKIHKIELKEFKFDSHKLVSLRNALSNAQRENLLMKTGTPGEGGGKAKELPPHVPHGHAFAILGYDNKSDLVEVWNPWGNSVTPKGPDGLENGYYTKTGRFFVPLKEFVEIFNVINFETKSPSRD